ncbi:MAG: hypothetical protein Fur0022_15290 [Anaerolineales bacterium]
MRIRWNLLALLFLFMCLSLACSGQDSPEPLPTMVVDEACQGIVGHSFLSTGSFLLGETEQGPAFGPYMVSFLMDGRVIWKYSMTSYIGTFTCENGAFEATFSEGERKSFEGTYTAETDMIRIDDVNYLKAIEE